MARKSWRQPPVVNPKHVSFKPDRNVKGSYYRRLDDIKDGLKEIDEWSLPPGGQFLVLYYGCEKLAKGIVGVWKEWEAEGAYDQPLHLHQLKDACRRLSIPAPEPELDALFCTADKSSARHLRDEVVHNFGPSNVSNMLENSAMLNPRMRSFLGHVQHVLTHLSRTYAHLL